MTTVDPLGFLYLNDDRDRLPFGDCWCGPDVLKGGTETLVARYESADDGDGQTVEVYCLALPARFYTLKVLPGPNSIGEMQPGYSLSTGSSAYALAATVAKAIAEGMFGLDHNEPDRLSPHTP